MVWIIKLAKELIYLLQHLLCVVILKRVPPKTRVIYCNDSPKTKKEFRYSGNYVSTTKYRWYTFIIQNILEQFMRVANIYFLLISILQVFTPWSPTGRFGTVIPLILFMGITLIKDGIEDLFRSFSDVKMNNTSAQVLRGGEWKSITWKNIRVGDIVKTMSEKQFPCDMVLLTSTEPQALCYIQTASLDGETNLKNRQGLPQTMSMKAEDFSNFEATIECELPNERLYDFTGNITIKGESIPINPENILLRGALLRNTEHTIGVCIFAGIETKLMQNSKETPHKVSKIERTTNYMIVLLFFFILLVSITCLIGWAFWISLLAGPASSPKQWNVYWLYEFKFIDIIAFCVTFFVLFNNFIPISLYVTMELTKVWQAVVWINSDVKMFHDDGDEGKPARVKTASLVEELGQVEYVFSDKTGTLTQNKMEFLKFTVNGKGYGKGTTEIGRAAAVRRGEVLEDDRPKDWKPEADGFQFYDPSVSKLAYRKDKNATEIENFWKFLAICHTVIPEPDKKNPGGIFYNASSPDEGALVKCAKYMGYEFNKRTHDTISYVDPDGKEHSVKILNILEFNSTRKRMSIIFRDEDGTIKVYCKGADSVIWKLMSKDVQHEKATNDLLDKFGGEGLRTLLCAERVLEEKVWKDWNENHWQPAITDLSENKKDKVAEAAGMMEVDLQLVGSTAIEDKLQDGVPATISTLQRAGIKVWVLTGDKQETAINIGYACAMLDNDMYKVIFNEKNKKTLRQKVLQETANLKSKMKTEKGTDFGVIVDGDTLSIILNWDKDLKSVDVENGEALRISFLKLCMMCKSVICCRVSPLQKAQVVQLVKNNLGDVITLAIGDGANDVSMIQAAHIGVGISGEEGEQASRSADFAIAQFRFLQRLLLVHGRYAYRRVAKLILYFFYKNATVQFTQFFYIFFNGFSGTSLFDNTVLSLYNVIWTSLPVLGLSFFDKDVSAEISEEFPELYILGQKNYYFNVPRFGLWFLNSIYHSAICFFVPQFALQYVMLGNGNAITERMMGTLIMGCVIIVVTLKIGIEQANWNPVFIAITIFTIFIYPIFLFLYHLIGPLTVWITPAAFKDAFGSWTTWLDWTKFIVSSSVGFADSLFIIFAELRKLFIPVWFEIYDMVQYPVIWLTLLIVIVLCLFKDILMKGFARVFMPQLYHSLQETRSDKATRDYITSKYSSIIESLHPPKRVYKRKLIDFIRDLLKKKGTQEEDVIETYEPVVEDEPTKTTTETQGGSGGDELEEIKIDDGESVHVKIQQENNHGFAFNQTENQTGLLQKFTSGAVISNDEKIKTLDKIEVELEIEDKVQETVEEVQIERM